VRVFRFQHIPADSFMGVIEQLGRKEPLRGILSQIPIALNQPANAVVIVAPPEAMGVFERLRGELDQPSEFHERMAHRQMMMRQAAAARPGPRKPGCMCQNCPGRPMMMQPQILRPKPHIRPHQPKKLAAPKRPHKPKGKLKHPAPKQPHKPKGKLKHPAPKQPHKPKGKLKRPAPKQPHKPKGKPRHPAPPKHKGGIDKAELGKALGSPVGQFFRKLMSEAVIRELRMDKRQVEAIRKVCHAVGRRAGHMRERVIRAIREMPPHERKTRGREIIGKARGEMGRVAGEARKRVFGILRPDQRKAAGRILGAHGPAGPKGSKPSGSSKCPKGKPAPSPAPAPRGCGGCGNRDF